MGRRDNRPYYAAYELACMICENKATLTTQMNVRLQSLVNSIWLSLLIGCLVVDLYSGVVYLVVYIIAYCLFHPSKYAYT
jgi:uncharacterized protein (DUF2062 family)